MGSVWLLFVVTVNLIVPFTAKYIFASALCQQWLIVFGILGALYCTLSVQLMSWCVSFVPFALSVREGEREVMFFLMQ